MGPVSFLSFLMRLPANKRLKREDDENASTLEKSLIENWENLDRMLLCSKQLTCVVQYKSTFILGGREFEANLVQSLSFTIQQINHIMENLEKIKT